MQIREVSVRYRKSDIPLEKGQSFKSSVEVFRAFQDQVLEPVEVFRVIHLNGKNRMLCVEEVARGTLTACLVHPREVFGTAVHLRAAGIIAVHNHPSGDKTPSVEDMEITNRLKEAGKMLGIKLMDHIIIGEGDYYSFADDGLLV